MELFRGSTLGGDQSAATVSAQVNGTIVTEPNLGRKRGAVEAGRQEGVVDEVVVTSNASMSGECLELKPYRVRGNGGRPAVARVARLGCPRPLTKLARLAGGTAI